MGYPGWGSWSFDPLVWAVLLVAGCFYATMLRRVRRVTGQSVGPGHWLFYFSGLAVLFIALGVADRPDWRRVLAVGAHVPAHADRGYRARRF